MGPPFKIKNPTVLYPPNPYPSQLPSTHALHRTVTHRHHPTDILFRPAVEASSTAARCRCWGIESTQWIARPFASPALRCAAPARRSHPLRPAPATQRPAPTTPSPAAPKKARCAQATRLHKHSLLRHKPWLPSLLALRTTLPFPMRTLG